MSKERCGRALDGKVQAAHSSSKRGKTGVRFLFRGNPQHRDCLHLQFQKDCVGAHIAMFSPRDRLNFRITVRRGRLWCGASFRSIGTCTRSLSMTGRSTYSEAYAPLKVRGFRSYSYLPTGAPAAATAVLVGFLRICCAPDAP